MQTDTDAADRRYHDPVEAEAHATFGVPYLFPAQRLVVDNILDGCSQIVLMPTGSGKSLCFQLPARLLAGPTMVIVPLLSLLQDQLRRLREGPLRVAALMGAQEMPERRQILHGLAEREIDVLFTTPEALAGRFGEQLLSLSISHCVIDEAHCISEWGDRFRPAYVELGAVIRAAGIPVVSAFTATASDPIVRRIREVIYADAPVSVVSVDPDRTNLRYSVRQVLSKRRALVECAQTMARPLIAFASSRGGTEHYARHLQAAGIGSSRFYHAGLDADERRAIEQWFFDSADGVLVATSAYGMGVDKGDIRSAVHLEPPPSMEAYLQEAGRAGRDGRPAEALLLHAGGAERRRLETMAPADRRRYTGMLDYAASRRCRREQLLAPFTDGEVACSGCDVCDREVTGPPPEAAGIADLVRRHRGRFGLRETALLLGGQPTYEAEAMGLRRTRGFGFLRRWREEEIDEALAALLAAGTIERRRRGFVPARLCAPRRRSLLPVQNALPSGEAAHANSSALAPVGRAGRILAWMRAQR